jgi:diguanylate cyclase (GGDEF)-like protein
VDIRSLFLVHAALLLLFGIMMLVDSVGQSEQEGNYWFAASNFSGALGLFLRPLFPHASAFVVAIIPNLLLFIELSLLNKAVAEFVQHGRRQWIGFLGSSLAVSVASYYVVFVHPNPTALADLISLMTISTSACTAVLLFRYTSPAMRLPMFTMGIFLGIYALNNIVRLGNDWVEPTQRFLHVMLDRTILAGLSVGYLLMTDARLRQRLEHQVNVDPLTGVLNRRALESEALQRIENSRQQGQSVSALMLDIDHFKQINDTYGHHAGDRALQALTDALRSTMRASDLIVRMGGDEFLVILSGIHAEQAAETAERLRRHLETLRISTDKGEFAIQVSIGVTSLQSQSIQLDDLMKLGDRSLYAAKAERTK